MSQYQVPLRNGEVLSKKDRKPIVTSEQVKQIFCNLGAIVGVATTMVSALEHQRDSAQTGNGDWNAGPAFLDMMESLGLYRSYYIGYQNSMMVLSTLTHRVEWQEFVEGTMEETGHRGISTFLIMPIQRLPRYQLLLKSLLEETPAGHSDRPPVAEALKRVTKLANEINAAMEKIQNLEKLLALEKEFISRSPIGLVLPNRKIVRDGMLDKVCRKGIKKRRFVVLTDLLVYGSPLPGAKDKWVFSRCIDLKDERVKLERVPPQHEREFGFAILSSEKSFIVLCESQFELDKWMSTIQECADSARAREAGRPMSIAGAPPPAANANEIAPVWVEDSLATECAICGIKFTMFKRRHHCRQCGRCICSKDSPYRKVMGFAGSSNKPVRICTICHEQGDATRGSKDALAQARASSAMYNLSGEAARHPDGRPFTDPGVNPAHRYENGPSGAYDTVKLKDYGKEKPATSPKPKMSKSGGRKASAPRDHADRSRDRPLPKPKKPTAS